MKRIIIKNGKKYRVTVPDYAGDDFGIWMEFTGSVAPTGSIDNFRITEDGNIRIMEDGTFRITEQ